jgi:iron complex outermembrane receptor protein/hemoglobin/transferrin/lactoferrin receptor protein
VGAAGSGEGDATPTSGGDPAPSEPSDSAQFSTRVRASRGAPGRATSTVTREQLDERLPRSAPDALRYEPGVYVQQTAHGQGSAFLRGVTGQHTVLLYDGVRLNNSLYRQGPNQYFFTIDSQTIDQIVVQRGSASVRHGSDAIGGAIEALPIHVSLAERPTAQNPRPVLHGQALGRFASADREAGGRARISGWLSPRVGLVAGGGYRTAGLLDGRPVENIDQSVARFPEVPRYTGNGLAQLGTGFREGTADLRLVIPLGPASGPRENDQLVLAAYQYLQFDAPRTDQCPPAYAPLDECLIYEEQFRTLAYASLRLSPGLRGLSRLQATASYQLQHERRRRDRPLAQVRERGLDQVHTLGLALRGETASLQRRWFGLRGRYGLDLYHDQVESQAALDVLDLGFTRDWSRGQYIGGSRYTSFAGFAEAEASLSRYATLRTGGRLGLAAASVPADAESATQAVDRLFMPYAFDVGIEVRPRDEITLLFNLNQGFRTPNLDDMSSRQVTGPGFQFENAALQPERSLTAEAGLRLAWRWVSLSAWFFNMGLHEAIVRRPRSIADCPRGSGLDALGCATSWSRFQLVNIGGRGVIWGAEGALLVQLPLRIGLSATLAYAYGEAPNPTPATVGEVGYQAIVPLSRIPPLNGTAELRFRPLRGMLLGAGLRWATAQTRLAPIDYNDARIPRGGTPGFAVVDLRAGLRLHELLPRGILQRATAMMVVENAGNVAYRYHGSSVNGPSSSVTFSLEIER